MTGAQQATRPAAIILHIVVVAIGMTLGAVAGFVGVVVLADTMEGDACEPDESAGCGGATGLLAMMFGLPFGVIAGAVFAHRLMRRAPRRAAS